MKTVTTATVNVLANEVAVAKARLAELQDASIRVSKREKKVAKATARVYRAEKALKKGVLAMKTAEKQERRANNKQARQTALAPAQKRARQLLLMLTQMAEVEIPNFLSEYKLALRIQFFAKAPKAKFEKAKPAKQPKGRLSIAELFKRSGLKKTTGPKKPSFNLSADNVNLAFFDAKGKFTSLEPKTLKHLLKTDDMNQLTIDESVQLFMFLRGSTRVEDSVMNENTLVQRNSESMLVRDTAKVLTTFPITKKDPLNREDVIVQEVEGYDNTKQLNLKVSLVVEKLTDIFTSSTVVNQFGTVSEDALDALIKNTILNGVLLLDESQKKIKVFTLNSAAPSQTRKGEAAFWQYGEQEGYANMHKLLFNEAARSLAVYGRFVATYRMHEYGKLNKAMNKRVFKMDKDPKRTDMPASGSRPSNVMGKLFGQLEITDRFPYQDDENKDKEGIELTSVNKMMGGVKRNILIIEDPTHLVRATAKVVNKLDEKTGKPAITTVTKDFEKNLVDGGILVSPEITQFLVAEGILEHEGQSFQGRGVAGVKPFAYGTPMLKEETGYDMILMSGALKLDVLPALLEGRFEFAVVQGSRKEFKEDIAPVATQALLATGTPKKNLKRLHQISKGRIQASLFSASKALKLLGVTDNFDESKLEELDANEEFNDIIEGETGVKAVLKQAPRALKDGVQKQRLASLLTKSLEKIVLGNVLVDDAKMRHMGFDIFMVMSAVKSINRQRKEGVAVPKMEWVPSIPAGCAVVVDADGNLRVGEFIAARYPALKREEIRKVFATDKFGSEEARAYYEKAAKMGFFKGLVLFNSVDMTTEAMSGADFDGDTCLVIFNSLMVEPFENKTPILDFYLSGTSAPKGGCPWSEPKEAVDLRRFVDIPEGLEVVQRTDNNGRTWELEFNEEDVLNRPQDVYYVFNRMAALHIVETSKASSIGLWTNRLMNIEDIQLEIQAEYELAVRLQHAEKQRYLLAEGRFYDDLATWLTCVVRWAIDEAKHGGAFARELTHVLSVFTDAPSPTKVREDIKAGIFKMGRMF